MCVCLCLSVTGLAGRAIRRNKPINFTRCCLPGRDEYRTRIESDTRPKNNSNSRHYTTSIFDRSSGMSKLAFETRGCQGVVGVFVLVLLVLLVLSMVLEEVVLMLLEVLVSNSRPSMVPSPPTRIAPYLVRYQLATYCWHGYIILYTINKYSGWSRPSLSNVYVFVLPPHPRRLPSVDDHYLYQCYVLSS